MPNKLKLTALAAAVVMLTGCNVQSIKPGPKESPKPEAYYFGAPGVFSEVGLDNIETLWVPARYSHSKESALYFGTTQYVAPGGFSDVLGFIHMQDGYLVAVSKPATSSTTTVDPYSANGLKSATTGANHIAFFMVDQSGKTKSLVGTVDSASKVVVTDTAIYARQFVRRGLSGGVYNYTGFDENGNTVLGPQGVRYAAPMPNGEWFSMIENGRNYSKQTKLVYRNHDKNGKMTKLAEWRDGRSTEQFMHTTAVFVNREPVTDSARTGYVMKRIRPYSSMGSAGVNHQAWAYPLDYKQPGKHHMLNGDYGVFWGEISLLSDSASSDLTERVVLFGEPGNVRMATQMGIRGEGNRYVVANINDAEPSKSKQPIFDMIGGGKNLARAIFAGNSARTSVNELNDAYAFITPDEVVFVLNNNQIDEIEHKSYAVNAKIRLMGDEMEQLLFQYGISR